MQAAAFQTHPYRHPVIGWKQDLLTMRREDLYEHYRTFYTPNNAVAVAVGDFDGAQMADRLDHFFGGLAGGPTVPEMRLQEPGAKGGAAHRFAGHRSDLQLGAWHFMRRPRNIRISSR